MLDAASFSLQFQAHPLSTSIQFIFYLSAMAHVDKKEAHNLGEIFEMGTDYILKGWFAHWIELYRKTPLSIRQATYATY